MGLSAGLPQAGGPRTGWPAASARRSLTVAARIE